MRGPCPQPRFPAPAPGGNGCGLPAAPRGKAPFLEPQTGSPRGPRLAAEAGGDTGGCGCPGVCGMSPGCPGSYGRAISSPPLKAFSPIPATPRYEPRRTGPLRRGPALSPPEAVRGPGCLPRRRAQGSGPGRLDRERWKLPPSPSGAAPGLPTQTLRGPRGSPIAVSACVPGPSVPGTGKKRRRRYRPREPSGSAGGRTEGRGGQPGPAAFVFSLGGDGSEPFPTGAAPRGGCPGWRGGTGTRRGGAPRAGAGCGARPGAASRGAAAFLPFLITD